MVDEKYFMSEKMIKYILNVDGISNGTGFCTDKSTVNPSIAHAICTKSVGGIQRCGIENYIAYGLPDDYPCAEVRKLMGYEN